MRTTLRHLVLTLLALALPALLRAESPFQAWAKGLEARGVQVSAGVWDLPTGKLLEGHHETMALIPASTTKVVSTYAMLKTWKPDHELETEVWGDLKGGVVQGDLVVKGGGDPFLTHERVWAMAQELKKVGVKRVLGDLRTDQSAFDGQLYGNGWENTSADTTPPIAALSVNFARDDAGRLVGDPDRLAREVILKIFRDAGIEIERHGRGNGQPAPHRLLSFPSPPLRSLVWDINKFSNNFMVETLVKRYGDGSWATGVKRIQDFYQQTFGIGPDQIQITDGSGLSKHNRLSAKTLAIILRAGWHDFEVGPEFVSSLKIIGGEPWKLRHKDPNMTRRVRVKTGHLSGVITLCGYIQTLDGKIRVFGILLNGPAGENDLWDQVSRWAN